MQHLIAEANKLMDGLNLTTTENGETAFRSTGDKNIDLFGTVNRDTSIQNLVNKFTEAWNEEPELAIKVMLNFRDIREGKGEKLIPKVMMFLIKLVHPEVYKNLLPSFVEMGCWKDILFLVEITHHYCKELETMGIRANTNLYNIAETQLFADQLTKDIISDHPSLCAKWAPTEGCHYDKKTGIAKSIMTAMSLKPKAYRKMLTELRAKIVIVETQMSESLLYAINFSTLPSRAHLMYKKAFLRDTNADGLLKDDRVQLHARYMKYLEDLKAGKTKANFKGVMPHEIIAQLLKDPSGQALLEDQWKSIRKNVEDLGVFDYCIPIVDVSGSMETGGNPQPIDVAIALGMLVSECAKGPFKNRVITFHQCPEIINLSGCTDLLSKTQKVKSMPWGGNTDIEAVFDKIIQIGVGIKLAPEQMPKRLFIFTDMQFDEVSGREFKTFDKIRAKFEKHGYTMPQIICWNLRTVPNVSFTKDDNGVCLMSGFSTEIMKAFLTSDEMTPLSVFLAAIGHYKIPELTLPRFNLNGVNVDMINRAAEKSDLNYKDPNEPERPTNPDKVSHIPSYHPRGGGRGHRRGGRR